MGGSILVEATERVDGGGGTTFGDADAFEMVTLSEDGSTLTWKLTSMAINMDGTVMTEGFDLVISGIRANASSRGDGQDIVADD